MPKIQSTMQIAFDFIGNVVETTVDLFNTYLLPVLQALFTWIQTNMPMIKEVTSTTFQSIIEVATNLWNWFSEFILPIFIEFSKMIVDIMPIIWDTIATAFSGIIEIAKSLWDILKVTLIPIFETIYKVVADIIPLVAPIFKATFGLIGDYINNVIETIKTLVGWISDALTWLSKLDAGKVSAGVGNGQTIAGNASQFVNGQRAFGGSVMGGGSYLVGERGPEIFTPSQSGYVSSGSNLTFNISGGGDPQAIANTIVRTLRAQGVTP
jgi:phage-related protein